jgi:apolipoprotein N-acyltransferase
VVDPLGRVVESLPLGREGVIDSDLPRPTTEPLYKRVGDVPAYVIVAIALAVVIRRRLRPNIVRRGEDLS